MLPHGAKTFIKSGRRPGAGLMVKRLYIENVKVEHQFAVTFTRNLATVAGYVTMTRMSGVFLKVSLRIDEASMIHLKEEVNNLPIGECEGDLLTTRKQNGRFGRSETRLTTSSGRLPCWPQ
jgi:hypothetical protein